MKRGVAAKGFQAGAEAYERGRPGYPADAVDALIDVLGVGPGVTVVDLAAGTGKLTRLLAPSGAAVIAIEPVEAMRRTLAAMLPRVPVVAGTAESMPLRDGSAGAVVAAQAFHWFDGEAALAEIHRVLAPGGRLGLVWNVRDETVDWVARLTALIDPYQGDAPRFRTGAWRTAFEGTALFGPLQERSFSYEQPTTPTEIEERFASISFVAALPSAKHAAVRRAVRDLLATHLDTRGRDHLRMPHRTVAFWCERAVGSAPIPLDHLLSS
ncbi:MAG TPA: methyltransferase domain-containing protein [Actinomycetota bacterium]|nr:methyltransferase domain-containing protein [Actinomycetota bacterium]